MWNQSNSYIFSIFVTIYLKTKWAKINIHFENIRYCDSEFNKVENVKFNQDMFLDNEHYTLHLSSTTFSRFHKKILKIFNKQSGRGICNKVKKVY